MRRTDREMNAEFAWTIVDKCPYATLSMVTPEGAPYAVPLSIAISGGTIYFHAAAEGRKTDCLNADGRVCIVCVGDVTPVENDFSTEYESAILQGTARLVTDEAEKTQALRAICQRYTPKNMAAFEEAMERSLPRTAVWAVALSEITGKRKKLDAEGREMKFGRME